MPGDSGLADIPYISGDPFSDEKEESGLGRSRDLGKKNRRPGEMKIVRETGGRGVIFVCSFWRT